MCLSQPPLFCPFRSVLTVPSKPRIIANLVHKPLAHFYYRWLFGHTGAISRGIGESVRQWESRRSQGDAPAPASTWDQQYSEGQWKLLAEHDELIRYAVLAGYAHELKSGGAILDVGCGEGLLQERLTRYERYLGIDISQVAISRARKREGPQTRFITADASLFSPQETFDLIIFNESLYYFASPLKVLERYAHFLSEGGVLLISMFRTLRSNAIARLIRRRYMRLGESSVRNQRGEWLCIALRPTGR